MPEPVCVTMPGGVVLVHDGTHRYRVHIETATVKRLGPNATWAKAMRPSKLRRRLLDAAREHVTQNG